MAELCDFCDTDSLAHRILNQTEYITSFLSDPSLASGHALIIANEHVERPDDLSDIEILAMQREADRLSKIMLCAKGLGALGVDRWQKSRPFASEGTIKRNHLHVHVLPSKPGVDLYGRGIHWGGEGAHWLSLSNHERESMVRLLGLEKSALA